MSKETLGARLKKARAQTDISQSELGRRTDIRQSRLSQIESDQRSPTPEEWERLGEHLDLGSIEAPDKRPLPLPREHWRASYPELRLAGERAPSARHFAAQKSFGAAVDQRFREAQSQQDPELTAKFLSQACSESGYEYFLWVQLLAAGGVPRWFAPTRAGYRALCIVERESKRNISDLRLPCLDLIGPEWDWLLFPQVTLDARKAYYRLDALACLLRGKERYWINLEVDGGGHDAEFDHHRQRHLNLPTLRLNRAEVGSPNMLAILEQKASALLLQRKAS